MSNPGESFGQSEELSMWMEEHQGNFFKYSYRVKETLLSGRSDFQKIDIVDTIGFGKMLFNDGLAMISERDEFVYHEMIAHVPLFVHPNPKRVLVIGGGDGGTVREVIRHPSVEFCRLVEIDPLVVEGCRQHIPLTASALADPKVTVNIEDGVRFVAETEELYDVVIIDSTDPIGPAAPLFNEEFYGHVYRILSDQGLAVSQAESPFFYLNEQMGLMKVVANVFDRVHVYNYSNVTYPGGLWSFSFASKGLCPLGDFQPELVEDSGLTFSWYNSDVHRAAFALPEFQRKKLQVLLSSFKSR